jgi:hypothetical protein
VFIEKAKKVHGDKYDYSKVNYKNTTTKVEIICPKHGSFNQYPYHHLGGSNCKFCNWERFGRENRKTNEQFIQESIHTHGTRYNYSKTKYQDHKTPVVIICPDHGDFSIRPDTHLRGSGCTSCVGSGFERLVKQHLEDMEVKFNVQYSHEKCKGKRCNLRFDFALFHEDKLLGLIECDGDQHLTYTPQYAENKEKFYKNVRNDVRKNLFCKKESIPLLRLHYQARYRTKDIIGTFVQDIKDEKTVGIRCIPQHTYIQFYTSTEYLAALQSPLYNDVCG